MPHALVSEAHAISRPAGDPVSETLLDEHQPVGTMSQPLLNVGLASENLKRPNMYNLRSSHQTIAADEEDSEDINEHVLLTPPAQAGSLYNDPFESIAQRPHTMATASGLSQALHDGANVRAFHANFIPLANPVSAAYDASQLLNGLTIKTDFPRPRRSTSSLSFDSEVRLRSSTSAGSFPVKVPGVRARLHSSAGSISPGGSLVSSPQIAAMLDITPLPSPTISPFEIWRTVARTRSRGSSTSSRSDFPLSTYSFSALSPPSPRRKGYPGLPLHPARHSEDLTSDESRSRTRSISEYIPEALIIPKPRNVAVSGSGPSLEPASIQSPMVREEYLGVQRGIVPNADTAIPAVSPDLTYTPDDVEPAPKRPKLDVFTVNSVSARQPRHYERIRDLGQGTFSKVYLAVRQVEDRHDSVDYRQDSVNMAGVRARSRRLVAVKVVEQGPAGGADAERIEVSLKREVDLLKQIKHPSLVHLKAFGTDDSARSLLVMNYCPGGDLFDVASKQLEILTPSLVRRIFAELVSAVRYLHQKFIVHRDIKLENVLLNIPIQVHSDVPDWQTLDRAVVTLTDLGLSRRIPEPPENPLLTTRCGSEDYAAPEILMGQPYDGRQTDAWALGVLLYALMEGRLPFDPLPGARGDPAILRARTPHRIARCEWAWVKYGDEDGDWDAEKGKEFLGAFTCVDGLLKRNTRRKALTEIRDMPWVKDGILIDGGLRWVEEEAL